MPPAPQSRSDAPNWRRSEFGLQSAVEASECTRKHQRHQQHAGSEYQHVRGSAQVEAADTTDEQIGDCKIEKAPEDVDRRGGQAFARRGCKRTLKGIARDSIDEMGHRVGQECAPEEVGQVVIPAHDKIPPVNGTAPHHVATHPNLNRWRSVVTIPAFWRWRWRWR